MVKVEAVKSNHRFRPKTHVRAHLRVVSTTQMTNTLCGKIVGDTWTVEPLASVNCKQCVSRLEQRKRNSKHE